MTHDKVLFLLSGGGDGGSPSQHTIGFSGESPSALLSQIAADTGGIYRYVPTWPGDSRAQSTEMLSATELAAALIEETLTSRPEDRSRIAGPYARALVGAAASFLDTNPRRASQYFCDSNTPLASGIYSTSAQNWRSASAQSSALMLRGRVAGWSNATT